MHFQLHFPQRDRYRYTFLRRHGEAFLRCADLYVRDCLYAISRRKDVCLADFYGLPTGNGANPAAWGPRFRHRPVTVEDPRLEGRPEAVSSERLPGILARADQRFALLGPGGTGKTALLLYLFFECFRPGSPLEQAGFVPCYVKCDSSDSRSIEDLVARSWQVARDAGAVKRDLEAEPRCLLLFDLRVGEKATTDMLRQIAGFALNTLNRPGHRVVVALRDTGGAPVQTARTRFQVWSLRDGWGPARATAYIESAAPPEQRPLLVRLLSERPELSESPVYSDLLVDLAARSAEALGRIENKTELLWVLAAKILDQERENWPAELAERQVWNEAEPALPYRAHPIDLLLQELAVDMKREQRRAMSRDHLDELLVQLKGRACDGTIRWWPASCVELLDTGSAEGVVGIVTSLPLFRVDGDRLFWLHDSFGEAFFFRHTLYDRKEGRRLTQGPARPAYEQARL